MSKNYINELKKVVNEIEVFIPSSQKNIKIKPLTLKQQKDILDNLSATATALITFFNKVSDVIENSYSGYKDLLVVDRPNILISLRNNIDNMYNDIDLNQVLEKNKNIKAIEDKKTFKTDSFKFEIKIPSISRDRQTNDFLIKNTPQKDNAIIGKLYVNEVVKFIEKITIIESETEIDFNELPIKEAFEIVQNIESSNFKEIYKYIGEVRDFEKLFVTLEDKTVDVGPELFVL